MSTLMIVESPTKARKIAQLFPDFTVVSTVGHFRDLPTSAMGVAPPKFIPEYEISSKKSTVVGKLRSAAKKADEILIATDLDREGEAIAWHVQQVIGKAATRRSARVRYSEITPAAITRAIEARDDLNIALVRAQEARRVLDRLVGYTVSPALSDLIQRRGCSAGRVQSVALKLICQRDAEITDFVPVEHYGVRIGLLIGAVALFADWDFRQYLQDEQTLLLDRTLAEQVRDRAKHTQRVIPGTPQVENKTIKPPRPLTTSDLLQSAARLFGTTARDIMRVAQTLFEAGLITYHRTDSPTIDPEFVATIRAYAQQHGLPLPHQAPTHQAGKNAQEAHEGIRVTDIERRHSDQHDPTDLVAKIYHLVWYRTLASQLAAGTDQTTTLVFFNPVGEAGEMDEQDLQNTDRFTSTLTALTEPGWRAIGTHTDIPIKTPNDTIPAIDPGTAVNLSSAKLVTRQTTPPSRYSEATLVKKMEARAIGRPSTYASIIETLLYRQYLVRKKQQFVPTSLGVLVYQVLDDQFDFMSIDFTASMEAAIDDIAQDKADYRDVVAAMYHTLVEQVQGFRARDVSGIMAAIGPLPARLSGAPQRRRAGKGVTSQSAARHKVGDSCPECKAGTLRKKCIENGKNTGKHFLGCTRFPHCRSFRWCH